METEETRQKLANAITTLRSTGRESEVDGLVAAYKEKYRPTQTQETQQSTGLFGGGHPKFLNFDQNDGLLYNETTGGLGTIPKAIGNAAYGLGALGVDIFKKGFQTINHPIDTANELGNFMINELQGKPQQTDSELGNLFQSTLGSKGALGVGQQSGNLGEDIFRGTNTFSGAKLAGNALNTALATVGSGRILQPTSLLRRAIEGGIIGAGSAEGNALATEGRNATLDEIKNSALTGASVPVVTAGIGKLASGAKKIVPEKVDQATQDEELFNGVSQALKPSINKKGTTKATNDRFKEQYTQAAKTVAGDAEIQDILKNSDNPMEDIYKRSADIESETIDKANKQMGLGSDIPTDSIVKNLEELKNKPEIKYSPAAESHINYLIDKFEKDKVIKASDMAGTLKYFNQTFGKNTPESVINYFVADHLREQVYKSLESLGEDVPQQVKDLRKQYGALKVFNRDLLRAINRKGNRQPAGFSDQIIDPLSSAEIIMGMATGNAVGVAKGLSAKAVKNYLKNRNNPGEILRKTLKRVQEQEAKNVISDMKTRKPEILQWLDTKFAGDSDKIKEFFHANAGIHEILNRIFGERELEKIVDRPLQEAPDDIMNMSDEELVQKYLPIKTNLGSAESKPTTQPMLSTNEPTTSLPLKEDIKQLPQDTSITGMRDNTQDVITPPITEKQKSQASMNDASTRYVRNTTKAGAGKSSLTHFMEKIRGTNLSENSIKQLFDELVKKEDYSPEAKIELLGQAIKASKEKINK